MIPGHEDPDATVWRVPISEIETRADDLPANWAAAVRAVTHDLEFLRDGRPLDIQDLIWTFDASDSESMLIGAQSRTGQDGFLVGLGFSQDAPAAQCTVWTASAIQDELAGYRWILWPFRNRVMLDPQVIGGVAVWVDKSTSATVPIGELHGGA
ncbi:hypothetical protein [Jongsikchunia kroppenstedtii]|uniref:hypothetical protein n=1 Tax=Jongsikchunia kroppenstedtii TaxID=1121721 RepID=UPI0003624F19|nr:hypothetical protein [Jongsikchunia kroppenstedtii]